MHLSRAHRNEHAFTVVEVVIAVIVLGAVVTAVTLASVGGSKLRGAAKLQAAITATGLQVQEDIATNRAWMDRPACRNLTAFCDVTDAVKPDSLILKGIGTSSSPAAVELVWARAQAIDSDVDLKGQLDKDGVIPDFFKVDIRIRVGAAVATRYDSTPAKMTRDLTTTIDRRGREQTGSLAVEFCRVTNQVDERMSIQGCGLSGASGVEIAGCPPVPRQGCVPAFGWIAGLPKDPVNRSPFVMMQRIAPASFSFQVRNTTTGQTWSSSSAKIDAGLAIFQDLPAGGYQLLGLPASSGANTDRWVSKEIPSYHGIGSPGNLEPTAVVEAGLKNRALVMFKPSDANTGAINIFADREVHDYAVVGPAQAGEWVVDEGTPTSSYLGGGAAEACSYNDSQESTNYGNETTCDGVFPGPGPNCATVYVTGNIYKKVADGTGHFGGVYGGTGAGFVPAEPGVKGADFDQVHIEHAKMSQFCTTYSEYHTYTYYYGTGPGPARYLDGAVEGDVEYKVTPMPDNRVLRISGSTIDVPGQRCFIANQREQCNLLANYGKLQPGLNSGLIIPPKYVAGSAKNTNRIDFPGWLKGGALWVHANGTIDTPAGTIAKNTQVHIRGLGECYWTSPKFAGKQEGPCNSCEALWTLPDGTVGGCSILTRDDVVRKVYEVYTGFDMETGAVTLVAKPDLIATDAYTINFTPAWRCSTKVPSLRAKTCARLQTGGGGPVSNPGGSYVSPRSGGTAIVDSAPISEGGA